MADEVRYEVRGPLARVTLARPPLNVLSTAMLVALAQAFERAEQDPQVRLVRLDAEGKLFSAGVDVADHVGERIAPMMDALWRLFDLFSSVSKPSVAVVHAAALGGGCEIALGTDLCLASDRASFGQPEIRLGLFAPPASVLLPRLVGERRALGLLLSGETIPAAEAERLGMVNAVLPHDSLEEEVSARLDRLLALSGAALRLAKQAVRASRDRPVREAHREVRRLYLDELMRTADAAEGLSAFLDKRPASWKHA
jgi:cyclohexa-1,5-dienecarbonyl-CoA hydratase